MEGDVRVYVPERLRTVVGFGIDRVAAQAGKDPEVLRLENLDTDIPPPEAAMEATRAALDDPAANSYLPFIGRRSLRDAVAAHVSRLSGVDYHEDRNVVITAGGTQAITSALLAVIDPGDEVVLTDPTYAGLIQRVTMAAGRPVTVPLHVDAGRWRLDRGRLEAAVSPRTRAMLLMSPSMPSGHVYSAAEWEAVAEVCRRHDLWLLYDAAMERLLFDGLSSVHPASLPGMAERTVTLGSVSKELRMIGWRIGWAVAPEALATRIVWTHTYNVVTPPGLTQPGAEAALRAGQADGVATFAAELQRRRDEVLTQLSHLPIVTPEGGWSLLIDATPLDTTPEDMSHALLTRAKVAATPMTGWGDQVATSHLRLVYAREPLSRLGDLRHRFAAAGF